MPLVSQTFDQLLDFTRTSSATFVGSNGLVQSTPASVNLLTWTQQFDNAAWGKSRCSISANVNTAPDGTSTADRLTEDNTLNTRAANISLSALTSGATHTFSCFLKNVDRRYVSLTVFETAGTSGFFATFDLQSGTSTTQIVGSGTVTTATIVSVGDGWYRCAVTGTIPATSALAFITPATTATPTQSSYGRESYTGDGVKSFFLWGAQLEAASAATTYTRNNGGVFPPRFDYDPVTLAAKGLLIEEQRTNLLLYSGEFDDANWLKLTGGTGSLPVVTANAGTAPDGTTTADRVVLNRGTGTTSSDVSRLFQNAGVVASVGMFSVYLRSFDGVSSYTLRLANGGGETNITVTPTWQRFFLISTNTAVNAQIRVQGDQTQQSADILVWGAQLEAGAFATSYIPTVASQVTRTADQCSIVAPNFASWYNPAEGTFVAEFDKYSTTSRGGVLCAGNTATATTSTGISLDGQNDGKVRAYIENAGALQLGDLTLVNYVANTPIKGAVAYAANNAVGAAAGALGTVSTSVAVPTVDNFQIGAIRTTTAVAVLPLNGHIRSIRYYPTRLTNAQLQALTA